MKSERLEALAQRAGRQWLFGAAARGQPPTRSTRAASRLAHRSAVTATATLDRRLVGISAPRLLVGRLVAVEVDAALHAPGA